MKADTQFDRSVEPAGENKPLERYDGVLAVLRQTRQICEQRSFVSFVLVNFCQTCHVTFLANFTNIIGNHLLGTGLSSVAKNVLYGSLFVIPRVRFMFLVITKLIVSYMRLVT